MKRLHATFALLALVAAAGPAFAQRPRPAKPPPAKPPPPPPAEKPKFIEVTVLEIAAGRAYLQPGVKGSVRKTATVLIKGKEYTVVEATDSYAVIKVTDDSVREKDKGRASIVEDVEENKPPPPPPRPLATWASAWTPEAPPADAEQPRFVPLGGEMTVDRRYDLRVGFTGGGYVPLGSQGASLGFVTLDARLHAAPFSVPAALDFDGSFRLWSAADLGSRVGGLTRSTVMVRELLLSYGRAGSWYAGLGRMRYAATTLGALDGLRVEAPLGKGVSVGAFGGLVPNPLGGEFSVDAQRFGVEARFSRPDAKLRPEAALVAHGSTFGGNGTAVGLDERRLSAMFGLYPGHSRLGGHVEVSNFDKNNPWKAAPFEVTGAGLDQSVRIGPLDLGARFDLIAPERSRWLSSFLPLSWFCRTIPGATPQTDTCDGRTSMRATGAVNAGLTIKDFSVTLGGTAMGDVAHASSDPRVLGVFGAARLVRVAKLLRFDVTGNYSDASSVRMGSGGGGVGVTLLDDALDISVYYRRAELLFTASNSGYVHHDAVGGMIVVTPHPTMMFTVQAEGSGGSDANALYVFGTALWRPRL